MDVFITWSGDASRTAAEALEHFLPRVMQAVQPFFSTQDIRSGQRWRTEIAKRLESSHFGILCLTPDNTAAPWVLFEAGALSKSLEKGRVVPFVIGLEPTDITGPLAEFQSRKPTHEHVWELVVDINAALGDDRAVKQPILLDAFDQNWERLQESLQKAEQQLRDEGVTRKERQPAELLQELLEVSRGQGEMLRAVLQTTSINTEQLITISRSMERTGTEHIPPNLLLAAALRQRMTLAELARGQYPFATALDQPDEGAAGKK